MVLLVLLLKGEVTATRKLWIKFYVFNRDNNTKEEKEALRIADICFRRKGGLENKKSIS